MLLTLALLAAVPPTDRAIEAVIDGEFAVGVSDGNPYLAATERGAFDHLRLYAAVDVEVFEALSIGAGLALGRWDRGDEPVELVIARARWRAGSLLVDVGRSALPLGLDGGRSFDGTRGPFPYLARGLYGASGFFAPAYTGVGLAYRGASLRGELFAGHIALPTVPLDASGAPIAAFAREVVAPTGGARATVALDPLTLSASGYVGRLDRVEPVLRAAGSAGLALAWRGVMARAEVSVAGNLGEPLMFDVYAEAGYRYADLALTGRFDWLDRLGGADPRTRILRHHQEIAAALTFWAFEDHVALKAAYAYVIGNRFARADEGAPTAPRTHAGIVSVAFGFEGAPWSASERRAGVFSAHRDVTE